jgi:tryptophan synthase alpha chain
MSRIAACFQKLQGARRKALIPYITAGDPHPSLTVPLMHGLVEAGCDILELGVPFSDPMADGPVIQRAGDRALKHGVGLADVLRLVGDFRKQDQATPVVLMGYANPIEAMGVEKFMARAKVAGVDGVIVVDYPPEECQDFCKLARQSGIDPVFLLAPTSTDKRIEEVARLGSGYLYYVSLRGVTGAATIDLSDVAKRIPKIRAATRLPIGVGFGIRDAESARRVAETADAVVIGSRIIQEIEDGKPENAVARVQAFIKPIRQALDARRHEVAPGNSKVAP